MEVDESNRNLTSSSSTELTDESYQNILKSVLSCVQFSNKLPGGEDYILHNSFAIFRQLIDVQQSKCLHILQQIMGEYKMRFVLKGNTTADQMEAIIDLNDQILEQINRRLDIVKSIKSDVASGKPLSSGSETSSVTNTRWNASTERLKSFGVRSNSSGAGVGNTPSNITAKCIEKPQIKFSSEIDNSSSPFVPIITEKPHSLRPLSIVFEDDIQMYSHPYEFELEAFKPDDKFLQSDSEIEDQSFISPTSHLVSDVVFVETEAHLNSIILDLLSCNIIAVDVEHHSYRTYLGLTCLIQISTAERDYIIDTISLHSKLQILNEVFCNPKILKVFHGADMDVEWLQRDCGLYVVHMFDTHQASKLLNFPRLSLAYLLQHFCNVQVDKQYQLADWRIRPLPMEMILYAIQDTHYLIHIYRHLKNLLLMKGNDQKNLLHAVYRNSSDICLKRYVKPITTENSYLELYRRSKKNFNNRQLHALKHLYLWRDKVARAEDESLHYVLPNHMLMHISQVLPHEVQGILACCNPVPFYVKQYLYHLHKLILNARSKSLEPNSHHLLGSRVTSSLPAYQQSEGRHGFDSVYEQLDSSHVVDGERLNQSVLLAAASDALMESENNHDSPAEMLCKIKTSSQLNFNSTQLKKCDTSSTQVILPFDRYQLIMHNVEDENAPAELKELIAACKRSTSRDTAVRVRNVSPDIHLEAVLPEAHDCSSVYFNDTVPKRLRLSRSDVIREKKKAGTYVKPKRVGKRKRRLQSTNRDDGGDGADQTGVAENMMDLAPPTTSNAPIQQVQVPADDVTVVTSAAAAQDNVSSSSSQTKRPRRFYTQRNRTETFAR